MIANQSIPMIYANSVRPPQNQIATRCTEHPTARICHRSLSDISANAPPNTNDRSIQKPLPLTKPQPTPIPLIYQKQCCAQVYPFSQQQPVQAIVEPEIMSRLYVWFSRCHEVAASSVNRERTKPRNTVEIALHAQTANHVSTPYPALNRGIELLSPSVDPNWCELPRSLYKNILVNKLLLFLWEVVPRSGTSQDDWRLERKVTVTG